MLKKNFEFEVLVNGKPVQEYLHEGNYFIEGKESTEFSLRFRNNSSQRVLFVPTIDGLSIMDGNKGSYDSSGYIVDGHDSLKIEGWRTSDSEVAKFYFSKLKDSYASKMGQEGNTGVIGCAVFDEKVQAPVIQHTIVKFEYPRCRCIHGHHDYWCVANGGMYTLSNSTSSVNFLSTSTATARGSSMPEPSGLGTGFGTTQYSPVTTVSFEREKHPAVLFVINYNTRKNLEAMGIQFKRPVYASPSPFPGESGYCKPPEDWQK